MQRTDVDHWSFGRGARLAVLATALSLGLAACAGADDPPVGGVDDGENPQIGSSSRDAVEADTCAPPDLDFTAAQTCAGPWVYNQYSAETSRHNLCGCQVRADCSFWQPQPTQQPTTTVNFPGINCFFQDHTHQRLCDPDFAAAHTFCSNWFMSPTGPYHLIDDPADQMVTTSSETERSLQGWPTRTNYDFECKGTIEWSKLIHPDPNTCPCATWNSCSHAKRTQLTDTTLYDTTVDQANLTVKVVTDPVKTLAQVRAAHAPTLPGQIKSAKIAPLCSTAEDVPSGDYPAKLLRLITSLNDSTVTAKGTTVVNEILSRAKEAYEFFTNANMSAYTFDPNPTDAIAAFEDIVKEVYDPHPDVEPACGQHAPAAASPCSTIGYARLRLCARLTSAHVQVVYNPTTGQLTSGDTIQRLYAQCIQGLDLLASAVTDGTCRGDDPMIAAALDVHRKLHDKLFQRFGVLFAPQTTAPGTPPPEVTDTLSLRVALHNLNRWYNSAAVLIPDEAVRRSELDLATNKFWQAAQGYKVGATAVEFLPSSLYAVLQTEVNNAGSQVGALEAAMGTAQQRGFRLDRAVLKAAYGDVDNFGPNDQVLSGAPLLRVTQQALAPLVERLDMMVQLHDVGCWILDSDPSAAGTHCKGGSPTETSKIWNVLGHLTSGPGTDPTLSQVLDATAGTMSSWKPVFQGIASGQQRLIDATANRLDGGEFAAVVARSAAKSAVFQAAGQLTPSLGNRLYTGVNAEQRNRVRDHLDGPNGLNAQLDTVLADINSRLQALAQGLVRVLDSSTGRTQLEATRDSLALDLNDLHRRESSFSQLIVDGAENTTFETLMADWAKVTAIVDANGQLRVGSTADYFLSGQDAAFTDWDGKVMADVAIARVGKVELNAHQGLSIAIEPNSVWSPTCVMRTLHVASETDGQWHPGPSVDLRRAFIGPEGFTVSQDDSGFVASTKTATDSERWTAGTRLETCGSYTAWYFGLEGSARHCLYLEASFGHEDSNSWQTGAQSRTNVQLAGGLYAPSTPFEAPVGSLVVVEMPRGVTAPAQHRNVHFVRGPHTTIVVEQDSDLYLVENDLHCDDAEGQNKLHVTLVKYQTVGTAAEAMMKRMACTLGVVRQKFEPMIARGEVLPSEIQEIEHDAKFDLVMGPVGSTCDAAAGNPAVGFEQYPLPLQELFLKFLAREMKRLEAGVRLVDLRNQIAAKNLAYFSTVRSLANNALSGYLLALSPEWTAQGMRLREMRDIVDAYATDMRQYLGPVIKIWFPGAVTGTTAQTLRNAAQGLANVTVDTGEVAMANQLRELGHLLSLRVGEAELPYPLPEQTAPSFVQLRFPKPANLDPVCKDNPAARCRQTNQSTTFRWATVAQTRALWNQLGTESGTPGTMRRISIQMSPDDIYQLIAGTNYLSCSKSLPAVRRIGLAATGFIASDPVFGQRRSLEGMILEPAIMTFPGIGGSISMEMVNTSWLQLANVPLVYTTQDYGRMQSDFNAIVQDVRGVSPFSTFVFDLPEDTIQAWKLRDAGTLDVLLELEAVRSTGPVQIPACSTP